MIIHGATSVLLAQDVEAVIKAPWVIANGGTAFNQIANFTDGNVRSPYSYFLSGNLNFNFLGVVNVPLSIAYSNQQFSSGYSLPFNRFSLSPSYKWVKLHAGYTSLQFSPYTLTGHEIFGGGVELTPGKFKFTAIYGQLKEAVPEQGGGTMPVYKRMGGGFKGEYTGERFGVSLNLFKAKDVAGSVHFYNPDSVAVLPQDNLSGSACLNLKITDQLSLNTEYGMSAVNRNILRSDNNNFASALFNNNGDVAVYHAIRSNLTHASSFGNIGATYERVAPNYTTLGSYYMLSDFENITANFSTAIKTINLSLDGGYQHDNLEKQKNNTTSRMIYATNISAPIGKKWNVGASFSNVQSYVHISDIYDQITQTNEFQNLDTLEYTQLNLTTSANASYLLQNTEQQRQSLSASFMYQQASEKQEYSAYQGNKIYNGALTWQWAHVPSKWNISSSVNYNHNQLPASYTGTVSGNLSVQKTFVEVLRAGLIATYSHIFNNEQTTAKIVNLRLTSGYTLYKKHNFNLSIAAILNNGQNRKTQQYSAQLAYSYSFGVSLDRKNKKVVMEGNF
ncbi:hypothetical protein AGMMS4956_20040 [Bacteroidia bacterium]|nr:hypothetical protein AGMMS4956_20040 [Bacteroidia bacterium]